MKQFLEGAEDAWAGLELRATGRCIRFKDQQMPLECMPKFATVGFEIDPHSQEAVLYVARGVQYQGANRELSEWLRSGEKRFRNFNRLREWITVELGPAYNKEIIYSQLDTTPRNPMKLTDMRSVRENIQRRRQTSYLDETELFKQLRARIIGQDGALRALAALIVRHFARCCPARPAVVFAIGPSGVGKTRTVEILAKVLREIQDTGYGFLRLDMSEYQEAHRVSQLIGAPQGYVGYGQGSQLLDALRGNPRTIVLFDEIEKAHSAILRVLMNAMDAGRLSTSVWSSMGREIDFRHAVFIFTSNLNANEILEELESRKAFGDRAVEDEVCRRRLHAAGAAPEIIGRIGRFLVYRPLNPETRAEIMVLAIFEVAEEYGLQISYIEPEVVIDLMQKVRSHDFGVRPDRILIDDALGSAFALAAQQGIKNPVDVLGPPYRCVTHN